MYGTVLVLHVLGASIWTGGHLILAGTILPAALRQRSPEIVQAFESRYERIGIPALLLQVATGIYLAFALVPEPSSWIRVDSAASRAITLKLALLGVTALLAMDARLRIIPRLSADNLGSLAWHILAVTALSVAFVIVGVGYRVGMLS